MLNLENLHKYINQDWQEKALPSLMDYIRIPNKSPHFDNEWEKNGYMEKAITHVANWCKTHAPLGTTVDILRLPHRTPLLFIEVQGQRDETVLLYGHLDKQPEMTGWNKGLDPWVPVLDNDRLYGRGAADDGYAVYASLLAIRGLQNQGIPHPRCVLIIEACEESGSYDLPFYLEDIKERIGQPALVIGLDSGAGNYDQFWMTTSLRGLITIELTVELLKEGVHSGNAGGVIADSFRVARYLLTRLENEKTGQIQVADLYCPIPTLRYNQAQQCAEILKESVYSEFPIHESVRPCHADLTELILNRTWRPSLTVIGAQGFPSLEDAGNVLRPKTTLKLSFRIPPIVCPKKAAKALETKLCEDPPYGAKITCHVDDIARGWEAPSLAPWLETAVVEASLAFYGRPSAYMGEGGSIPFMSMLGEQYPKAQFVITGVLGPKANAHGPNEFLDLPMAKKLTASVAYILSKLGV